MPRCKCHYLFTPFIVLNERAQHGLDLCGLSQLIPCANQAGNGVYFTPSILPTVKSLKDDYISVDLTVGGLCPKIKSLATMYPPLFTISTIGLWDVSRSTRTRSLHTVRGASLLPGLVHQTAAELQVHGPRRDESIPPPGNLPMWLDKYLNKLLNSPKGIVTL